MRSVSDIVQRIESKMHECFNFEPDVLLYYVPFTEARAFLKPEVTESQFEKHRRPLTREAVLADAAEYMRDYGWPKALGHRGISAGRTIDKMRAWMWLICDKAALEFIYDEDNYAQYGAPVLLFLCERFGWPVPDDARVFRMARGELCEPDCDLGCGR